MSLSFDDIQNLWGFRICNSSSFGALAFTLCDMVASLEEEVEQIWGKPWTNLKWLYVAIRIISFGSQMISTGITLRLTREGTPTLRHCRAIAGFQGVSSVLLMMAVQTILILRVQALYFEKKNLKLLLRGLFAAEILIVLTIFAIAMPGIKFGIYCVITSFPATATGFFIIPVLFEFLLFVMTMAKFYRAVRDGWGQEDFISRFLRDGIWAFALPFTILTANTFCLALLDSAISSVAFSWAIAIPGFASCRLILNMDHLLRTQRVSLPRTSEQEVMDTVFLTNDIVTADLITYELREPGRTPTQMDL
ncbi:hypothetical protein Hypma_015149 [Hypsizygus marmoreus]|uniref:DUF6533 domain-containing protein n=1 Tax=Hypsizygus marmoreus TaxID=39966 RepID=A0A369K876_HYPMA|nr:hypothetical protein Hypma_015149 [Hypsizygus marmoreus]